MKKEIDRAKLDKVLRMAKRYDLVLAIITELRNRGMSDRAIENALNMYT